MVTMSRSSKIMLTISAVLVVLFALVLNNDHTEFLENIAQIAHNLESDDPHKLEAAWFTIVVYRSALFLIPAFILAFLPILQLVTDHLPHKSRR